MTAPSDFPGSDPSGPTAVPEGLAPPVDPPAAGLAAPPHPDQGAAVEPIRLLLLLGSIWLILVWASMADNPLLPFVDAVRLHLVESQWLLWLMGLELVRQIHYLVSEHWSAYHRFWSDTIFGGFDRAAKRRFSDWTRFRLARIIKLVAFVALFAVVAGQILETSPVLALFETPALGGRRCR